MSYKNIKTQSKNSVGTITISREKEKNSLDSVFKYIEKLANAVHGK